MALTRVRPTSTITDPGLEPQRGPGHRRHKRARAEEILVRVRVGNGVVVAKVDGISVGGLFARTQHVIPVGAFVEMDLLRPGHEQLPVTGVIVADAAKRSGLAVSFQSLSPRANTELRRAVLDQHVKSGDVDVEVSPTRAMTMTARDLHADEGTGRDRELDDLRRRVATLTAENEAQRKEIEAAGEAQRLVGRLQMEIERLKARSTSTAVVDADLLSDIKRDAETAWMAIARLSDNCDKIR
jgi:hypothetical protein